MSVRGIILAAGKGTRMKSGMPKVLHEICGRPMLWYVIRALRDAGVDDIVVVTNPELHDYVAGYDATSIIQEEQLGTGHAVGIALAKLQERREGRIVVAYGDMPLIGEDIFRAVLQSLEAKNGTALAMVTVRMPLPSNFGRVLRSGANVRRIVEVRDASDEQLRVEEMNAGIYAYNEGELRDAVAALRNDNAQKEYYLTDTIETLAGAGKTVVAVPAADHAVVLGINDRAELAVARHEMNARLCARYMRDGVTIVDPRTTYLEPELHIGRDTVIYPNTSIGRLSEIGQRCVIGPNSRLSAARLGNDVTVRESVVTDATLGDDAAVGPFAHLRGEAVLGQGVRIGNFVEVKNSRLAAGVKSMHLAYIGDADVGERTNIGAGTITCNYDGRRKNATAIGRDVSIGSNTSLVAPITVGDGALTGAGSVVTKDVAPGERVAGNPARPLQKKNEGNGH